MRRHRLPGPLRVAGFQPVDDREVLGADEVDPARHPRHAAEAGAVSEARDDVAKNGTVGGVGDEAVQLVVDGEVDGVVAASVFDERVGGIL